MTLSLNASWVEAASREDVQPVFLLTLTDGSSTWKAQSAEHDTMHYGAGILSVGELAPEIDVMSRRLEVGEIELVVSDAWIRPLLVSTRLFGQKATLSWGFRGVSEANFVNYSIGSIDSIRPDGIAKEARLSLMSALELARRQQIVGYWIGMHPLEIIEDILLNKIGVHADLVDSASLDPDSYTGISHFVVSRVNQQGITRAITEPTEGFALIDELAQLCNGTLYVNEDGEVSFRIFDSTATEAATWTTSDIVSLEQKSLDENVVNRCEVTMSPPIGAVHLENSVGYAQEDDDSIAALAYPGTSERRITHRIESTGWLMGGCAFTADGGVGAGASGLGISAGNTATIIIYGTNQANFVQAICGTRESLPSQPANAKLSAGRPLYLLTDSGEIIKATGMTALAHTANVYTQDPATGLQVVDGPHTDFWKLTGVTRGALGTVAAEAFAALDITIPVYLSTAIVNRHAYGLSVIEILTKLSHYDKEPGDLVKIVWPAYLDYGKDGIDGSDGKFEILAKEVSADEGLIKWTLAFAGVVSPAFTYVAAPARAPGAMLSGASTLAGAQSTSQGFVASGLGIAVDSGLDIVVGSGMAVAGQISGAIQSDAELSLEADSDNHLIFDTTTQKLTTYAAAVGDPPPPLTSTQVQIGTVTTDATDVTNIDTSTRVPTSPMTSLHIAAPLAANQGNMVPNGDFTMAARR